MYSDQNSNTFLSMYNLIDKFFDQTLQLTRYVPFNEKLQMFLDDVFDISPIVKRYQQKLRYFWDLRNQIVHGFRLDHQHYVEVSDFAVEQIKSVYDHLLQPKSVVELFWNNGVSTCQLQDNLKAILSLMYTEELSHIPVYDDAMQFVNVLDESTIVHWIAQHGGMIDMQSITIRDIDLTRSYDDFCFVASNKSVYQLRELFVRDILENTHKRLGAVLVTATGKRNEPLQAIITALDLPKLEEYFIS